MLKALFRDLGALVEGARIRYFIFGGQAVLVHGRTRFTKDVDITVAVDDDGLQGFLEKAHTAGFVARISDAIEFARERRVLLLTHASTGIEVDVVLSGTTLETEALLRATPHDFAGTALNVISVADLVIFKIVAGRPEDLEDARSVIERNPEIEAARIRSWLRQFEKALDRNDLVSLFESMRASSSR